MGAVNNSSYASLLKGYLEDKDPECLNTFWDNHREYLYSVLMSRLNNSAGLSKTLLQNTFQEVKRTLDGGYFEIPVDVRNWLISIVGEVIFLHFKTSNRDRKQELIDSFNRIEPKVRKLYKNFIL